MFGIFTKYELYTFTRNGQSRHFTSGAKFITHDDIVYEPIPIERDSLEKSSDMEKNMIGIRFPITNAFAQGYLREVSENNTLVEIFKLKGGVKTFLWRGRFVGASPLDAEIELNFESSYTQLSTIGNQILFQRTCPYSIYNQGCKANKDNFKFKTTISSIDKLDVFVRGTYADGLFDLGMIQATDGTYIGIEQQINNYVLLLNPYALKITTQVVLDDYYLKEDELTTAQNNYDAAVAYLESLPPDDPLIPDAEQDVADKLVLLNAAQLARDIANSKVNWIHLYYGCNKTIENCRDKFSNLNNFGGFPHMPRKNPTSRSVV